MKRGCTGRISKQNLNRRSRWENFRRDQKSTSDSIKGECVVDLFLWEGRCSSWVCSTWSGSQWTFLLGGHEAFERGRAKEETWGVEKQDLDSASRQRTCSHVAPQPWIFGEARDACHTQPPYFLFPKLKTTLQGRRFQTIEELQNISQRDLPAIPQNAFYT
jgi:hypothetical protein